ncbi:hypothetical protein [Jiangella endophytica]|nr:hypothetical protein [Jiangella endophytica]
MIDNLRAELAYRHERVRRDIALTRRGATEEPARPPAPRVRPRPVGAVR